MPSDPRPIEIDEVWFAEWFELGWKKLIEYLTGWAFFDAWCLDHEQEDHPDGK